MNYVPLASLYAPGEEACTCRMVKDEAEKQKSRVQKGNLKTVQDDRYRYMKVKGDVDPAGFWTARAHGKFQATLTKNGLDIASQRVVTDRGNTGPMSGPGPYQVRSGQVYYSAVRSLGP